MLSANLIKQIKKLQQKKYREELQEFIVEGYKGVEEALKSDFEVVFVVLEDRIEEKEKSEEIKKIANSKSVEILLCKKNEAEKIKSTETFSGFLAVVKMKDYSLDEFFDDDKIVVLDNINDPGNLGTIIRTADWFGVKSILLSEGSVDKYNEKTVRSTMGSIFHTKVLESTNIVQDIELFKKNGYNINLLCMDGEDAEKLPKKGKNIYIFGSESHGIRKELEKLGNKKLTIKGKGGAESLNVSVAAGIILSKI